MPGFDSTGPLGEGPRTGRAMGRCRGGSGLMERGCGMGRGMGMCRGRGSRQAASSADTDVNFLLKRIEALEEKLRNRTEEEK